MGIEQMFIEHPLPVMSGAWAQSEKKTPSALKELTWTHVAQQRLTSQEL